MKLHDNENHTAIESELNLHLLQNFGIDLSNKHHVNGCFKKQDKNEEVKK